MSRKQTPSEFLKQIIGRPVVVKLNSGVDYRGEYNSILKIINICIYIYILKIINICNYIYILKLINNSKLTYLMFRCFGLFRWLHEHCVGANRRICQWTAQE